MMTALGYEYKLIRIDTSCLNCEITSLCWYETNLKHLSGEVIYKRITLVIDQFSK